MHAGLRADDFQDLTQGEAKAEAADEHACLGRRAGAGTGELGEHLLGFRGIGAHEWLAVYTQIKVRVMRMQREFSAIGRVCLGEEGEGLQES